MKKQLFTLLLVVVLLVKMTTQDKLLFVAVPLHGHFNPIRFLAREMQSRGHEVHVASTWPFIGNYESEFPIVNVSYFDTDSLEHFKKIADKLSPLEGVRQVLGSINGMFIGMHAGLESWIIENKPDLLVADYFTVTAVDLAHVHKIPVIVNKPALLAPLDDTNVPAALSGLSVEMNFGQRLLSFLLKNTYMFQCDLLFSGYIAYRKKAMPAVLPHLSSYFTDSVCEFPRLVNFVFGAEFAQHTCPLVSMVGHIEEPYPAPLDDDLEDWIKESESVVVANFGTTAYIAKERFEKIVEGLVAARNKHNFRVLWRVPKGDMETVPENLPSFIRIINWFPSSTSVLGAPNVRLFITHAGANSPYEALRFGVPLLSIPIIADQKDHAMRLQHHNLTIAMDRDQFTSNDISGAVQELLTNSLYRKSASKLSKILQRRGVKFAADIIEEHLELGYDHLIPLSNKKFWVTRRGLDNYLVVVAAFLFPFLLITSCLRRRFAAESIKRKQE